MGQIAGLKGLIPGIESIRVGVNSSPESLSQGYTLGFVVLIEMDISRIQITWQSFRLSTRWRRRCLCSISNGTGLRP